MGVNYNARVVSDGLLACWDAGNPRSLSNVNQNMYLYPEDFSNAYWVKSTVVVAANQAAAPDGSMTASLITATGQYPNIAVTPGPATSIFSVSPGEFHTISIYVKYVNQQYCVIVNEIGVPNLSVQFDLINGTASGSSYAYGITNAGNGWWRIYATYQIPNGYTGWNPQPIRIGRYSGTNYNGSSMYAWGAQLEVGSSPSTYYPVSGNLRSTTWTDLSAQQNNCSLVAGIPFKDTGRIKSLYFGAAHRSPINIGLYNQTYTGKTVFVVARLDPNNNTGTFRAFIGGSGGERNFNMYMYNDGVGWRIHWSTGPNYVFSGGFSNYLTTLTTNQWFIAAVSQEVNGNTTYYLNGVNVGFFTGYTFSQFAPSTNPEYIGGSDGQWYGDIAYLSLYTKALTTAEIQQNTNALRGRYGL